MIAVGTSDSRTTRVRASLEPHHDENPQARTPITSQTNSRQIHSEQARRASKRYDGGRGV